MRTHRFRPALFLAAAASMAAAMPPAHAQSAQDLNAIQKQIEQGQQEQAQLKAKAEQLDKEIADLQSAAVKAAGQVQDTEAKVTGLTMTKP